MASIIYLYAYNLQWIIFLKCKCPDRATQSSLHRLEIPFPRYIYIVILYRDNLSELTPKMTD